MRISGTTGVVVALIAIAAVGGGTFIFKTVQDNKKLELEKQIQDAKMKTRTAEAKIKEAEAKAKEAEVKKAETERKKAEAAVEEKKANLDVQKQVASNLKEKAAVAAAETKRAAAVKAAAEAESVKSEAAKAAAEAAQAEQKKRIEAETLALQRAQAEQKKAEAALAEKMAVKQIADAALAKSENERRTAEANAAAEHDRKLRLYSRANTSRAELLALKRAEKLLALEESGALDAVGEENGAGDESETSAEEPGVGETQTNAVIAVKWPSPIDEGSPAEKKVADKQRQLNERAALAQTRQARRHISEFGVLADKAEIEGRVADARYYRQTLTSLVPNYVEVYEELIDEARKAGDAKAESKRLDELLALVPEWQRVAVLVQLIERDEAYYSRAIAGRVGQDEYVKAFRKIYDEARRDKGDRDERDAKIAHVCKVLATYVPDFETSPEWK